MHPVRREEILDYVTWNEKRTDLQPAILESKRKRRVHLGDALTLLFENRDTVRYQIQEMVRVERMVKESEIVHELATYNELLGGEGEIGATLMVEIDDAELRAKKLREWLALPERIYLGLGNGNRVFATFDPRQKGEDRLSAVQFLKFKIREASPVTVGVDMPGLVLEVKLTEEQRTALKDDLTS
jgi:hypothetical protein